MKIFFLLPFLFFSILCKSQNSNIKRTWHWYFGTNAGIDFSSGTAVADTNGALVTNEGCASISDTSGNLLFYTDGRNVWNKLHQVMPNGTGLMGGATGSSTQQALIIPKPLSSNIYFLFTTDEAENAGANGMRYTIIDMNLDGGFGDVDITQKNILLFAPCTEKLAAVNHCNDTNVWVMGHELNNNNFCAYLINSNGINSNATISTIGHIMKNDGGMQGCMRFSPNGKKLCFASDSLLRRIELADFDNSSGYLSNPFTLFLNFSFSFTLCFSPDNSKLFISNALLQYDVTSNDSATISLTQANISSTPLSSNGLQHCINGGIVSHHSGINPADSTMDIILNPNVSGLGCNFQSNIVHLGTWQQGSYSLPNFNESYFNQSISNGCLTGISEIENGNIKIFPNPARDWIVLVGRGITSVEITNALGSEIGSYPTTASAHQNSINISSLSCGIYFFKINMIDERFSFQKIIIQH